MPSERWNRLERLFAEASALPKTERTAFLERNCGDDAELRNEIEELLCSNDAPGVLKPVGIGTKLRICQPRAELSERPACVLSACRR